MKAFERFKDGMKGAVKPLAAILAAGILLLVLARFFRSEDEPRHISDHQVQVSSAPIRAAYEHKGLEERLADILSLVDGAGRVRVLLHESRGIERVFAVDETLDKTETKETDGEGGQRSQSQIRTTSSHVTLSRREGGNEPLILYENAPGIEGVIIVAEGGGDIFVKDALTRAASSLLGVPLHKVSVLPMRLASD